MPSVTTLTESQRRRWERARAKGRTRIIVEQFLAWTGVAAGGPTLRAYLHNGTEGTQAYWTGGAGVAHGAIALLFGAVMSYIFGTAAWQKMERLYGATAKEGLNQEAIGHGGTTRRDGP